jgi:hypothetical protein
LCRQQYNLQASVFFSYSGQALGSNSSTVVE